MIKFKVVMAAARSEPRSEPVKNHDFRRRPTFELAGWCYSLLIVL
jgi:hypothetical protein